MRGSEALQSVGIIDSGPSAVQDRMFLIIQIYCDYVVAYVTVHRTIQLPARVQHDARVIVQPIFTAQVVIY